MRGTHELSRSNIFVTFCIAILYLTSFSLQSQTLQYDTTKIKVLPLSILNTKDGEYSPYRYKNNFFFISDRENEYAVVYYDNATSKQFTDLYKCLLLDSVNFTKPDLISKQLKTKYYIGPSCETDKGYYCTVNNEGVLRKRKTLPLQISFLEKDTINKKVKKPKKITFGLHDTVSCAQPSVWADTLMFFASNIGSGYGKIDLFYSVKRDGIWQLPMNCGAKVNSEYNESFPYFVNGKLYFASDRPGGFGGLDIYAVDLFNPAAQLELLSNPINSSSDDFGICMDTNQVSGYFSSNRSGNDDLYYFKNIFPSFKNCKDMKDNLYCYTFYEEASMDSKDTLGMTYEWSFGDGAKKRGLEASHCFENEGIYNVELNVVDKTTGLLFFNEVTYEFEIKNERQLYIHAPDTVKTGLEVLIHPYYTNLDSVQIDKYYWDFGDNNYSFQDAPKHAYQKEGTYVITLGVTGKRNNLPFKDCATKKIKVTNLTDSTVYSFTPPKKPRKKEDMKKQLLDSLEKYDKPFHDFIVKMEKLDSIAIVNNGGKPLTTPNINGRDTSIRFKVHVGVSEEKIDPNDPVFKGLQVITALRKDSLYHYFLGSEKSLSDILPYYEKAQKAGFKSSIVSLFLSDSLINNPNMQYRYMIHKDTLEQTPVVTNTLLATTTPTVSNDPVKNNPVKDPITSVKTNTTQTNTNTLVTTPTKTTAVIPDYVPASGEITYRVQIGAYQNKKPKNAFGKVSGVIEEKTEEGWYKYMTQDLKTLENANDVKNALLQMGYTHVFITPYQNGKRISIVEAVENEISIFFDLNSSIVVRDELEKLDYYFRNFSAKKINQITLEGHACYLGPTDYNYQLSKRRVFAVEKEIKVFTNATIIPKFFGETAPKYDNSAEKTRRLNRRVDVKINR